MTTDKQSDLGHNPKPNLKLSSHSTFLTKKTSLKNVLQKQASHFSLIPFSHKNFFSLSNNGKNSPPKHLYTVPS